MNKAYMKKINKKIKIIKTIYNHQGKNGRYGLTINGTYMERHEIFRLYEEITGFIAAWSLNPNI